MTERQIRALTGRAVVARLIEDFLRVKEDTTVILGSGTMGGADVVVARVGNGPVIGMTVREARDLSELMLDQDGMPTVVRAEVRHALGEFGRLLDAVADRIEAGQLQRLH